MNIDLQKKAKNDFEKYSFKFMNNAVYGKCEKTEILNLSQQKEEGIIQYQNKIIMLHSFLQKLCQQYK